MSVYKVKNIRWRAKLEGKDPFLRLCELCACLSEAASAIGRPERFGAQVPEAKVVCTDFMDRL